MKTVLPVRDKKDESLPSSDRPATYKVNVVADLAHTHAQS